MSALATWLWLVDLPAGGCALDGSETEGGLAAALTGFFADVHVLRSSQPALDRIRTLAAQEGWRQPRLLSGTVDSMPRRATFDCLALHDALEARLRIAPDPSTVFAALHPLVRTGGWLAIAGANPGYKGRRLASARSPSRLAVAASRAGFSATRILFAEPTIDDPRTIVPDAVDAVRAYETQGSLRGHASPARGVAARLGLRAALYPGYFLLARA